MRHAPAVAGLALLCAGSALAQASEPPASTRGDRPNLIVVLLDDADVEITESMPKLREMFMEKGTRFSSNIANTPLCGPARAIILSGQYAHNTRVHYNNGEGGGYAPWRDRGYDEKSLGSWLQSLGYRTGLFGKYINDFPLGRPETFVPKGWDDFRGILSDREARNNRFSLNENGVVKPYDAASGGYQTDLLVNRLDGFIRAAATGPAHPPFFAFLAVSAPHVPPEPAARHAGAFAGQTAPRKPSFNEADIADKPKALRDQAEPLSKAQNAEIDGTYRGMRESLLSVEEAMANLLKTLEETGELSRTYVFFTSDNGWHRGEHRIPSEKYTPYEESIRVPLFVRGPGVSGGRSIDHVTGLVDLAPTLLDLAGAPRAAIEASDGRSLVPLLRSGPGETVTWRESILIEHFGGGAPFRVRSYEGLRGVNEVYVEYATGEKEYYDLLKDPYELQNSVAKLSSSTIAKLSARLSALKNCAAARCRAAEREARVPRSGRTDAAKAERQSRNRE